MQMNRRSFLACSLTGVAALLLNGGILPAADSPVVRTPRLRFSSWLNMVKGNLPEQLAWVEKMGFESIELRGNFMKMRGEWKEALKKSHLVPSALDWSSLGLIVAGSEAERSASLDSLKAAIDTAADLKAPNIIIVPPRLNSNLVLPDREKSVAIIREVLGGLADRAAQAGTCLMIEPVTPKGVNCINSTAEGAALCASIDKPGVGIVFDFCQMIQVENDLTAAMVAGGNYIRQIHLSSRKRTLPGQETEDAEKYRDGFRGLKQIGYAGFCSFECGKMETYQDQVGASMDFLRAQWDAS